MDITLPTIGNMTLVMEEKMINSQRIPDIYSPKVGHNYTCTTSNDEDCMSSIYLSGQFEKNRGLSEKLCMSEKGICINPCRK